MATWDKANVQQRCRSHRHNLNETNALVQPQPEQALNSHHSVFVVLPAVQRPAATTNFKIRCCAEQNSEQHRVHAYCWSEPSEVFVFTPSHAGEFRSRGVAVAHKNESDYTQFRPACWFCLENIGGIELREKRPEPTRSVRLWRLRERRALH